MENEWKLVGSRIREERESAGLKLDRLAEQTGLDKTALSRIERGQRGVNSIQLRRISTALSVQMDRFFEAPSDAIALARDNNSDLSEMIAHAEQLARDIRFVKSLGD